MQDMVEKIPGQPEKVRRFKCRFSRPLYPGDPIKTQIWKIDDKTAFWKTINAKSGEEVITNGVFEFGDIPKDEIRFDGRVAVVTGAGGGLGRTYALELAKRGAKVVVNDLGGSRDGSGGGGKGPADKVVDEIKALGGTAVANYDSVSTPEGGQNIIKSAIDAFGTIDILINNAGILRDKSFLKMEPENWQTVMDVHLTGAYNVTKPAFAVMRDKGYESGATQWTEGWFAGMNDTLKDANGKSKKVFSYFLPTWGLPYVLSPNSTPKDGGAGTGGDWAMVNGPMSYQWGGTWVGAMKNSPNSELAKEFVKFVALDEENLTNWATGVYTNEYLKANGSFNWSTRIASFKFPGCQ